MKRLVEFLATGLFIGKLAPVAPGTFGTLLGVPLFFLLAGSDLYLWTGIVFLVSIVAVVVCHYQERFFAEHDSKKVVIDEVAGYLLATLALPWTAQNVLLSFVLFRIFDAAKPWPLGWLDRNVKGGFGTVVDDLAAGLITNFILQVIGIWIGRGGF